MLLTQQVVDSLNGIECTEGYFYEDSVPVAHRTIPQSRQLQCLQLLAAL